MEQIRLSAAEALLEAAFVEFAGNPGVSLATVAKRAGVGRGTLHRHFKTRSDLIHALAKRAASELEFAANDASKQASSYSHALQLIMTALVALGDRQWFLAHEDLTAFDDLRKERERQERAFHEVMAAAQKEGLFPEACPVAWAVAAFDHLVYAAWVTVKDEQATATQAANLAWTTFAQGIRQASF